MSKTAVSAICLFGTAINVVLATPASKEDKPPIPVDLDYEYKAVPMDENAIINWRRAAEVEVALNDKEKQTIKYCWTPAAREPSRDELDDLENRLRRNSEALKLFDESLNKPQAQWPEGHSQSLLPELKAVSQLIRARLFVADPLAEKRKYDEAAKSLEGSLTLTQRGVEGDAALIHYLVASAARTLVQDGVLRLACRKHVPLPMLDQLLKDLPDLDAETNIYRHILRVEFTQQHNDSIDLKKLAEDWAKISETNVAMALFPEECRRPFKVLLDPSLVPLHPKPLDWNLEMGKSARHYRIYLTNSYSAWTNRSGEVELGNEANRQKLLTEIKPLMELVKDEPLPLSRQAAQRARSAYLKIENPIGCILDCSIGGFLGSDVRVFHSRAEREATITVLAILIFERQKGILPAKLSDLVEENILDSIPIDPFSGAPILYSRERRIIWSVGEDGVDDDGNGNDIVRWAGDDAVWQIPELN